MVVGGNLKQRLGEGMEMAKRKAEERGEGGEGGGEAVLETDAAVGGV